jgi:hypothetical protein
MARPWTVLRYQDGIIPVLGSLPQPAVAVPAPATEDLENGSFLRADGLWTLPEGSGSSNIDGGIF